MPPEIFQKNVSQTANQEPLVSVLTPFHNEGRYLTQCIESILSQTYRNLELWLVDNASTDGSSDIAKHYAAMDSRVRLLRNPELVSQIANLNLAASHVSPRAKYVKYCFGDDWLYPNCLLRMVEKLEQHPTAGSVCAYTLVEAEVFPHGPHPRDSFMTGHEAARRYLLGGATMFGSPTASMYRAEAVHAQPHFFNPLRACDDIEPQLEIFLKWDFAFVHEVLSFTRREAESMSSRMNSLYLLHATAPICLYKYGPRFLSPSEYKVASRRIHRIYGNDLARAAFEGNYLSVLKAQSEEMHRSGYSLPKRAIAAGLLSRAAAITLNPYSTLSTLLRRLIK